jgi:hypothetical protein
MISFLTHDAGRPRDVFGNPARARAVRPDAVVGRRRLELETTVDFKLLQATVPKPPRAYGPATGWAAGDRH